MERRRVLITVKTYPNISKTHREIVCTAGIELTSGKWIRLYPIPFRFLREDQQYRRWSTIEAAMVRNHKDFRSESFRPDTDTLREIQAPLGTEFDWAERKKHVMPLVKQSLEQIQADGETLGIIKPKRFVKVYAEAAKKRAYDEDDVAVLNQTSFFDEPVNAEEVRQLEKIPYEFRIKYWCDDDRCKSHDATVTDWEIGQLYRNCRGRALAKGNNAADAERIAVDQVLEKIRGFVDGHDLHLMLGNQQAYPNAFIIIGLFYPPISAQSNLFEMLYG